MSAATFLGLSLLILLGSSLLIGLCLMAAGVISLSLLRDMNVAAFLAGDIWRSLNATDLAALPLFILMGEILFRTRLAEMLFRALTPWARHVPGGLLHVNVMGCTLFAAASGSSAATTATIGRITLRELKTRGYDYDLSLGSLCGSGTLGFLIPPSIILILYGVLADVSIIDLFIAGIAPGLILAFGYMAYIALRCALNPRLAPQDRDDMPLGQKLKGLIQLLPIFMLILVVIGAIYSGYAGPSEAGTLGVAGALLIVLGGRQLTRDAIGQALMGTVRTSSMIGLIIAGAFFLAKTVAIFGIPNQIAAWVGSLGLSPLGLILLLLLIYTGLGMVLDGLSIIVMTLPIALPLVIDAGFSPLWFGIFIVIVVEMSQITPPIGFNLFIVRDLTGETLGRIARASLPFFLLMAGLVVLITLFPAIVTWTG